MYVRMGMPLNIQGCEIESMVFLWNGNGNGTESKWNGIEWY